MLDSQRELSRTLMYLGHSRRRDQRGKLKEARQELILRAKPSGGVEHVIVRRGAHDRQHLGRARLHPKRHPTAAADARQAEPSRSRRGSPKEERVLAINNFVLHEPHPDLAYKFINFMLVGGGAASPT